MFQKKVWITAFLLLFSAFNAFAQENEGQEKWLYINVGLEGMYSKTTTGEFSYSPAAELKIKKIKNIDVSIEGTYIGNKLLYNGAAQSEVIKMGEILGTLTYSLDNGFLLGVEGSFRTGDLNYKGLGGGLSIALPFSEKILLEGSFSYDENKYQFGLVKITESIYNFDADFDITLNDNLSWLIGVNYNSTDYLPVTGFYTTYTAYTKLFYSLTDDVVVNGGVKLGQDSSKYNILGAMGGLNYSINETISLSGSFNYTYYTQSLISSKKSGGGKKSPYSTSNNYSSYSILGQITFSF